MIQSYSAYRCDARSSKRSLTGVGCYVGRIWKIRSIRIVNTVSRRRRLGDHIDSTYRILPFYVISRSRLILRSL